MLNLRSAVDVCKPLRLSISLVLVAMFSMARAETPKVFWHSQPVKPNETVMVQGHAIQQTTLVDAQRLDDGSPGIPIPPIGATLTNPIRISPLSFGESILNFVIPSNWPNGVFAYRLVNDVVGTIHLVNAPDPWFLHGDQGNRATPNGWVAIYGNTLSMQGGTPQLALVKNGVAQPIIAARVGGNAYAQYFDLPSGLPVGDYEVYVHNGFGGAAAWTQLPGNEAVNSNLLRIVSRDSLWETKARLQPEVVIDAANGLGQAANWDATFKAAIDIVKSHKSSDGKPLGGIIRVKPGVYLLDKYLALPDKTILVGENKNTTILQWGASPTPEPVGMNPLIKGEVLTNSPLTRGTFSIEDITLARTSPTRVGVCIERAYTITDEQSAWFRRIVCQEPNTAEASKAAVAAGNWAFNRPGFWMRATKNTEITDSTIDMVTAITLAGQDSANEFVRIENNTFRWRLAPLQVFYGLKNLVFAGNTELMLGTEDANGMRFRADGKDVADVGDFIGSFGHNNRDVYFSENQMKREGSDAPYQQTGFTLDGNAGVYFGKIAAVSGTRIDLGANKTSTPGDDNRVRAQRGAVVQILSGKGAGQWRHLISDVLDATKNGVNYIVVDKPWEVEPDSTSWLSVNDLQARMIFYGNNLENAPKLQPFYPSHDVIIAENLLSPYQNTNMTVWVGYRGWAYGSMTHGWHYQVLDNILRGQAVSMGTSITSPEKNDPIVPRWGSYPGYDGAYVSTHIYRNNLNGSSSKFEITPGDQNTGFLIENNIGLSSLVFLAPPYKEEMGLVRNNSSPEGNRPQLVQNNPGVERFPTYPGADVKLSYTTGSIVNLARSSLVTAVNDSGPWGRIRPIDGVTTSKWIENGIAQSGSANQAWIQADLRTSNVIQSVKIWPRLDANLETADVWVLVSPTPFLSGDVLETAKARPEVFSQFLPGKFSRDRTVVLPVTPLGGSYIGRYVRAWKVYPKDVNGNLLNGNLQFAEIEVFGYSALDLGVTVSADTGTVTQGDTVNYTVTVTNYGSNPAMNVTTTGTLADCNLGTIGSQASASCTRSVVTNVVGPLTQTLNVSASESESDLTTANNSATVVTNVQALMSVVKTGTGLVTSDLPGINCGADCSEAYNANTAVTLTAAAGTGSVFSSWSGCDSSSGTSCTVSMSNSKTVTANFTDGGGNQLQNGVPVTGLSGSAGSKRYFTFMVPAGASNTKFQISGGTGDADLYVRFGATPTTSAYDCRPYRNSNNETCLMSGKAGTWYVMIHGYKSFSGVTLVGSYQ